MITGVIFKFFIEKNRIWLSAFFFIFWNFFYYADDRGHENHEAWDVALGCAQSAYNL